MINSFADGTGFDFAGEDQQILTLPRLQLADGQFHWPEQTVSLGSVSIDNPRIRMSRDESGLFNVEPREMQSAAEKVGDAVKETAASENDQGSSENQWQLSIGNLAINGLALDFLDQSLSPEAKLGITDFNLSISDISNLPGKRFPTRLSLQTLNGGKLSLKGEVSVLPETVFDFDVNVDALQLAGLQPYLQQQANLNMESGAINLAGHISNSAEEPFLFGGDLEVVDLVIAESINNKQLASWKRFGADKIALSIAKRQLDVSQIHFDQLNQPFEGIFLVEPLHFDQHIGAKFRRQTCQTHDALGIGRAPVVPDGHLGSKGLGKFDDPSGGSQMKSYRIGDGRGHSLQWWNPL